jgi:hypothetical protein
MALKYADNVGSQLFDPIAETDTFAVVESVTSFPANISPTDFAVATIANDDNSLTESIKITFIDRPSRTLTIERGYDDSTPRDWPKGSKIEIRISSGFFRAFEEQVNTYTDDAISALETSSNTTTEAKSKAAFAVAFVLS